jgi:hypothetical protein
MTLSGAVAHSFRLFELGAVVRYGFPTADETIEEGFSESERRDFGALELRACRGAGQAVRVSACAGTELGAVRELHQSRGTNGDEVDEDSVSTRVSGTLAARIAHRGGFIEPELELAGAAVAIGREPGAPWLVLRVAAGAALAF